MQKESNILIENKAAASSWSTYNVLLGLGIDDKGYTPAISITEITKVTDLSKHATKNSLDSLVDISLIAPEEKIRGFDKDIRYYLPFVLERNNEDRNKQPPEPEVDVAEPEIVEPEPEPEVVEPDVVEKVTEKPAAPVQNENYKVMINHMKENGNGLSKKLNIDYDSRLEFHQMMEEIVMIIVDKMDNIATKDLDFDTRIVALRRYEMMLSAVLHEKYEILC